MLLGTVILPVWVSSVGVAVPGAFGVAGVTTPIVTVWVVVVAVPIWSLSITDLVLVPVVKVKVSGDAVIVGVATVTTAVALLQLPGFNFSQIWYTIVYVPAGVLLGTVILPVWVSSVGVAVPGAFGVAGVTTPMVTVWVVVVAVPIWSLSITDLVLVPVVKVKVSADAVIVGVATVTTAVALLQLPGFNFSQI